MLLKVRCEWWGPISEAGSLVGGPEDQVLTHIPIYVE